LWGRFPTCCGFPTRLPGFAACRYAGQIGDLHADSKSAQCAVTNRAQDATWLRACGGLDHERRRMQTLSPRPGAKIRASLIEGQGRPAGTTAVKTGAASPWPRPPFRSATRCRPRGPPRLVRGRSAPLQIMLGERHAVSTATSINVPKRPVFAAQHRWRGRHSDTAPAVGENRRQISLQAPGHPNRSRPEWRFQAACYVQAGDVRQRSEANFRY
jgi:hypothetical protein